MITGIVKFFNADKGSGFIEPIDGGNDAFVHIGEVQAAGMATLEQGQRVNYEIENDASGRASVVNLQAG
ncbi:MAG: cold-shock protein [Sphingomonas sp.]|nr:cold-shock protein [Sphingomonas sp.]